MRFLLLLYVGVLVSQTDLFLSRRGLFPSPIVVFLAVTLGVAAFATAANAVPWREILRRHGSLIMALAAYAAFAAISSARADDSEKAGLGFLPLADLLAMLGLLGVVYAVHERRRIDHALIVGAVLLIGSICGDIVAPGTFSALLHRPAGFAVNPNSSALTLCLLVALVVRWHRLELVDILVVLLAGLGVVATLSRSGLLLYGLIFAAGALQYLNVRGADAARRVLGVAAVLVLVMAPVAMALVGDHSWRGQSVSQARLDRLSGERAFVNPDEERVRVAANAITEIGRAPILGQGSGASRRDGAASHNIYLNVWWEYGVAGLLSYVALLVFGLASALRQPDRRLVIFWIVTIAAGMFTHMLMENRAMLVGLALTAAAGCQRVSSVADLRVRLDRGTVAC